MEHQPYLLSFGVMIMDFFPGELGVDLAHMKSFHPMPGGSCANVAVAAAKFGVRSLFAGKVGKDAFGNCLIQTLNDYGVETQHLLQDGQVRTTLNFHAKPASGSIEYLFYRNPGADANLRPEEIDLEMVRNASWIHLDSLCLTVSPIREATEYLLGEAKKAGVPVSFDCNYREVLWDSPREAAKAFESMLPYADLLKMNEDEYELMCWYMGNDHWLENRPDSLKLCIVTMGSRGSRIYYRDKVLEIPVLPVQVRDSIGCGDAFIAAFLSYLVRHKLSLSDLSKSQLKQAGLFADTAASLTAVKEGAMPAIPSYLEVQRIFAERMKEETEEGK